MAPEYAKAATALKEQGVRLAKVDATVHSELGAKYEVQGYPTLKWFKNGVAQEFTGGRTASDIITWVKKKSGPPAVPVPDVATAEKLAEVRGCKYFPQPTHVALQENEVVVIGFFESEDCDEAKEFIAAADGSEIVFGKFSNTCLGSADQPRYRN